MKTGYRTDERDHLHSLAEKYGTSPFTGECYIEPIKCHKMGKFYHIMVPEAIADKYLIPEDFLDEDSHELLMIKPTDSDDNYLFFRRI